MSKNWYPVINYENCIECGACFNKCSHGVYKKEGDRPVVVYPEGCVEGCRGCQNLCPSGAIEYVGDTGEKGELQLRMLLLNFGGGGRCEASYFKEEMSCTGKYLQTIIACPNHAISYVEDDDEPLGGRIEIDHAKCTACGTCAKECCGMAIIME